VSVERIDALMMKKCFLAGAKALEARKDYINELNVFPVPDGDTGTNMTMTIMAAVREINKITDVTVDNLCKAMSSGSLRGARGNSGVILSQIFRGFTKELKGLEYLEVTDLGNSIQHAADTAYKAVMKPKEGTILTVIKAGAERSVELLMEGESQDMVAFAEKVVAYMEDTLKRTPDMLPVLKQAGVVDSGGEGLMTFVRGALAALQGKEVDLDISSVDAKASPAITTGSSEDAADIKFGYCTEFIIMLERDQDKVEKELKAYLQDIGDCVVVVADDEIVKVHVHTNHPGLAFEKALTYGSLTSIKLIIAAIPCGILVEGITTTFLSSVRSLACSAARIMLPLFGRIYTVSAGTFSTACRISSVLGFIVWPPSITSSAPRSLKISLRPSPAETTTNPSALCSFGSSSL
jgi:uncharacterized protein